MYQKIAFTIFIGRPMCGFADQVATSASMSVLQAQLTQLNQQISSAQQNITAVTQSLQGMQQQSAVLQQQIAQYANTDAKQFKWVDVSDHQLPAHAFVAGENQGQPLYICQAQYSNSSGYPSSSMLIPGVVSASGCIISYAGQAYLEPDYALLTSTVPGYWISGDQIKSNAAVTPICPLSFSAVSNRALEATAATPVSNQAKPLYNALAIIGGQDNNGNTYLCRVQINGQYFVGKASGNACFIAVGSYEASWPVYQVLLTRQP